MSTTHNEIREMEQDANARLIAAASELLEVCRHLLENRHQLGWEEAVGMARAAVAKAEGTTRRKVK